MSANIIYMADRRPKARNLSCPTVGELAEAKGDEIAVFVLRRSGDASMWIDDSVQSQREWDLLSDFLKQAEVGLRELRKQQDE